MARQLKVAAAQLGPIHKADDRDTIVARLKHRRTEHHGLITAQTGVLPPLD